MPVCAALIIAHVDYETEARGLEAFRRADGATSVSTLIVTAGMAPDVLQAQMITSGSTHVCIIGSFDEIPRCELESDRRTLVGNGSPTPPRATPPYIGRLVGSWSVDGRAATATSIVCDERRARIQHRIDQIVARDRSLPSGRWTGRRAIGIAANEDEVDVPLLTGCRVMAHAFSMLDDDAVDPRDDVRISDGTKTWARRDTTETAIVPSPLPSSDCVFIVGDADSDAVRVLTSQGSARVLTTSLEWDVGCHPIVFAFVHGRAISSFAEATMTRPGGGGGPCAWCIFEVVTLATDYIQAVYTMWGIILSLRDATDARLGEVVYDAVARTQQQMDIDCIEWAIIGDPCTRLVRAPPGSSFEAVPPGTSWCLVEIDGHPSSVCPLECVVHCVSTRAWVLVFLDDRINVEYDAISGISVEVTASDDQQCDNVSKSTTLSLLQGAKRLRVSDAPAPELRIDTATGGSMRWTRLHSGNVDGASGCIHVADAHRGSTFQLTNLTREWYVQHDSRVVSWTHTEEAKSSAHGVVTARALAYDIVQVKATFDAVDRYANAADYQWSETSISFILNVAMARDVDALSNLEQAVRHFIAQYADRNASDVRVVVTPFSAVNAQQTTLFITTSWVVKDDDSNSAGSSPVLNALTTQSFGIQTPITVSDIAVTTAHVDASSDESSPTSTSGLHTVVNLQLKSNLPSSTLFPDYDSIRAWTRTTTSAIASSANVSKSRLQLSIVLTANPYICILQILTMDDDALVLALPILQQVLSNNIVSLPVGAKYDIYEVSLLQGRSTRLMQPVGSSATVLTYTAPPDVIYDTYNLLAGFQTWITHLATSMMVSPINVDLRATISVDTGRIQVQIGTRDTSTSTGGTPQAPDVQTTLNLPASVVLVDQSIVPSGTLPTLTASVASVSDNVVIINDEVMPLNEWCMCAIVGTSFVKYIDRILHIYLQGADGRFTLVTERNASALSTMLYGKAVWMFFV